VDRQALEGVLGGIDHRGQDAGAEPGRESDRTRRFLAERGLEAPNELVMVRFATAFEPERRHELIVF
jgi:hypothetical protein